MEALTRDSRRLSTTSMNTKRTFLLCRKADISTWGLHSPLSRLRESTSRGQRRGTSPTQSIEYELVGLQGTLALQTPGRVLI